MRTCNNYQCFLPCVLGSLILIQKCWETLSAYCFLAWANFVQHPHTHTHTHSRCCMTSKLCTAPAHTHTHTYSRCCMTRGFTCRLFRRVWATWRLYGNDRLPWRCQRPGVQACLHQLVSQHFWSNHDHSHDEPSHRKRALVRAVQ